MRELRIKLSTVADVKDFVSIVSGFESDMDIQASERQFKVDAKSIMGIFSLDLTKDLKLMIHDHGETDQIVAAVKKFII